MVEIVGAPAVEGLEHWLKAEVFGIGSKLVYKLLMSQQEKDVLASRERTQEWDDQMEKLENLSKDADTDYEIDMMRTCVRMLKTGGKSEIWGFFGDLSNGIASAITEDSPDESDGLLKKGVGYFKKFSDLIALGASLLQKAFDEIQYAQRVPFMIFSMLLEFCPPAPPAPR